MANDLSPQGNDLLSQVKNLFGPNNVTVFSGGRTAAHNKAIGGAAGSDHIGGNAFDFSVAGLTPSQVSARINDALPSYGQNITEINSGTGTHNHLSVETLAHSGENFSIVNNKVVSGAKDLASSAYGKALPAAKAAAAALADAYLPGSGAALNSLDGGSKSWLQQIQDWFTSTHIFERIAIAIFALIVILGAFMVMKNKSS